MKRHYTFQVLIFLSLLIFLSPLTAHAQCTGDFNSDSQVNFSDLLIFAVAYNTTSSDAKYNPLCDLNSDDAINFSDLLIFAVNYGQVCEPKIEYFEGIPYTGHNSRSNSMFLESRGIEPSRVYMYPEEVTGNSLSRGDIFNAIELIWNGYPNCQGFYLYRGVNGAAYEIIRVLDLGDSADITSEYYFGTWDIDIEEGNTYRYYVTAYNNTENWETAPSDIFTIEIGNETFLPHVYLQQPPDYATIEEPDYLFQWTPIGNIVPYGDVAYGETYIRIFDAETYSTVMNHWFLDDFTTSQATYDGNSLIPGRTYRWYIGCYGYDSNGQLVAQSYSEDWEFTYEGEEQPLTPGGLVYTWYDWPWVSDEGFDNFEVLLTIDVDPGIQSSYYWAHQFGFKDGDGGYMGLQTNGYMQGQWIGKMAIFSIWDALDAEPGLGASCEEFGGEGEGWSCRKQYNWIEGHNYSLSIEVDGVDEYQNKWWGAYIKDLTASAETFLGKIKVPASWKGLDYSVVWAEYYGIVAGCIAIPYAEVRFEQPTADNIYTPESIYISYGTKCTNSNITTIDNMGVIFETGI
jgi:hypothetical protein